MAAALDQPFPDSVAAPPATEAASITPPHSVKGKKDAPEGALSDLSDLELDPNAGGGPDAMSIEAEEEDIEPDHYYGGGKVPVFKPVSLEFAFEREYPPVRTQLTDWLPASDHGPVSRFPALHQEGREIWYAVGNRQGRSSERMVRCALLYA